MEGDYGGVTMEGDYGGRLWRVTMEALDYGRTTIEGRDYGGRL